MGRTKRGPASQPKRLEPVPRQFGVTDRDVLAVENALAKYKQRVNNETPGCIVGLVVFAILMFVIIHETRMDNALLNLFTFLLSVIAGVKASTWIQAWRRRADPFRMAGISKQVADAVVKFIVARDAWASSEKKRLEEEAAAQRAEAQRRAAEERERERLERERKREQEQRQREFWKGLTGLRFEEELAAVYQRLGFAVRRTPITGDEGLDLILEKGGWTVVVQCKRHGKPAGQRYVRDLYGAMTHVGARHGVLACTSGFTHKANAFAEGKPIELLDLDGIIRLARKR